mmetsp:Transcript_52406/g.145241  ORF Transcript_52406/g.145241 Transcript_52406/m.145241 type:complete len:302 (-) Transcript_52406:213-1118(-)
MTALAAFSPGSAAATMLRGQIAAFVASAASPGAPSRTIAPRDSLGTGRRHKRTGAALTITPAVPTSAVGASGGPTRQTAGGLGGLRRRGLGAAVTSTSAVPTRRTSCRKSPLHCSQVAPSMGWRRTRSRQSNRAPCQQHHSKRLCSQTTRTGVAPSRAYKRGNNSLSSRVTCPLAPQAALALGRPQGRALDHCGADHFGQRRIEVCSGRVPGRSRPTTETQHFSGGSCPGQARTRVWWAQWTGVFSRGVAPQERRRAEEMPECSGGGRPEKPRTPTLWQGAYPPSMKRAGGGRQRQWRRGA